MFIYVYIKNNWLVLIHLIIYPHKMQFFWKPKSERSKAPPPDLLKVIFFFARLEFSVITFCAELCLEFAKKLKSFEIFLSTLSGDIIIVEEYCSAVQCTLGHPTFPSICSCIHDKYTQLREFNFSWTSVYRRKVYQYRNLYFIFLELFQPTE